MYGSQALVCCSLVHIYFQIQYQIPQCLFLASDGHLVHRLRPEGVSSCWGSLRCSKNLFKKTNPHLQQFCGSKQPHFYLVFLYKHPGHWYVSGPDGVHERSDPAAVSAVWRVAASAGGSANA